MFRFALTSLLILSAGAAFGFPEPEDFYVREDFPALGGNGLGWVGAAQQSGEVFIVWNGDDVYRQDTGTGSTLELIASGYIGDPAFLIIDSTGTHAVLGAGASGNVYFLDLSDPVDFTPGDEINIGAHFSAAFLTNNILAVDRGGSPSEVAVVEIVDPFGDETVITKPLGSMDAVIATNSSRNLLYVTDAGNGQIKTFSVSDVLDAFDTMTPLDWTTDGTDFGAPFEFPVGGIAGFTNGGNAVIVGDGSIESVNVGTLAVVSELDPAGTMPFYDVIFNSSNEELIAIDRDAPDDIYATRMGLTAELPSDDADDIRAEYDDLVADFGLGDDLDGDLIPDLAMLELVILFSGLSGEAVEVGATALAYTDNLNLLVTEPGIATLAPYLETLAALLLTNADMQAALAAVPGLPLTLSYTLAECADANNCLPAYGTGPGTYVPDGGLVFGTIYLASADTDFDTHTNLTEYTNITSIGGTFVDFAINAGSPLLDGTGNTSAHATVTCFIATAAFGTPFTKELDELRSIRDNHLLRNGFGAAFVDAYYRYSPPIANVVAEHASLRFVVRTGIRSLLFGLAHPFVTLMALVGFLAALQFAVRRRFRIHTPPRTIEIR